MEIDVFISYHTASSHSTVEAVVNRLENAGIRYWYAPRTEWELPVQELERVLRLNSSMRGDIAIGTIDNRERLADTYAVMGRTTEAIREYEAEKTALENLFGADCDRILTVVQKLQSLRGYTHER